MEKIICCGKMAFFLIRLITIFYVLELFFGPDYFISCQEYNNTFQNVTYSDSDNNFFTTIVLFNQSLDPLNDSFLFQFNNLTKDTNITESDAVVTEDWENHDLRQSSRKYLSFTIPDEDICSCDLYVKACDINCCCDSDCNEDDIKVFSKCISQVLTVDKNYCYQKDIIFRNNTVYKMVKESESSLLCIVHDNLKQHFRFKDMPVINSHRDLDLLLKYQSKYVYSWDSELKKEPSDWGEIRAGNPIYIDIVSAKDQYFERHWNLPFSCFTRICSCKEEVRYLEDFSSTCSHTLSNLKTECETNAVLSADIYSNFCISSRSLSPDVSTHLSDLIIHTKVGNPVQENYTQPYKICSEKSPIKPKYYPEQNLCVNIVSDIHFTIIHSGYYGIINIITKFKYINISSEVETFSQHFSVNFRWYNTTDMPKKSGNPGYQIGLPILAGTNDSMLEVPDSNVIKMKLDGLSVLDRDSKSLCSKARKTVRFGKNLKTSCIIKHIHTEDCDMFQERIFNILLGPSKKQIFIGIFGNSNESNIDDWIEAYHEDREKQQNDGTCSLILGLKINIAYVAVGTVINPQFKILGVGYHYSKSKSIDFFHSILTLSTSVSFFDTTEQAMSHYPKVPSIKANLPSDFFYPFLYGNQEKFVPNTYLILLMLFYTLTYYVSWKDVHSSKYMKI